MITKQFPSVLIVFLVISHLCYKAYLVFGRFFLSDTFSIFDVDKETPLMNWRERFKQWNIKNPNWVYENLHSMQTTYYRAIKTLGSKK